MLFQYREFTAVGIRAADTLPQITAGKRFFLIQNVMFSSEIAVAFNRTRRIRRSRLQQLVILLHRKMLKYHARHCLFLRLRGFVRSCLFLRLRGHHFRHFGKKSQRLRGRASVPAGTCVIA